MDQSAYDKREHRGGDAPSFEVPGADGKLVRFARDDLAEIFETTDAAEAQRQVDHGWVILDQRQVTEPGRGPSGDDLIPGIMGLRVGGVLEYERGKEVTSYTLGFLKDGAQGTPVE